MPYSLLRTTGHTLCTTLARPCSRPVSLRTFATSFASSNSGSGFARPAPPPLPPQQQREFEELLRKVNAPLAGTSPEDKAAAFAQPEGDEVRHPDYRAKPRAEFEGETNPVTGEVGGPKREPLHHGDWAYGGKVTDF
ncbi:hypothetical protein JCM10207_008158 [Rhodosporidiobolus poonsookiae]